MTLEEASGRYGISVATLQMYENMGFLHQTAAGSGSDGYQESDFKKIGQVHELEELGMGPEEVKSFLALSDRNEKDCLTKTRILRKRREALLEEIHHKQQMLDHVDYYIHQLKQ